MDRYKMKALDTQRALIERGIMKLGSLTDLSQYLKVHKQTLNRNLKGKHELKYSTMLKLSALIKQ